MKIFKIEICNYRLLKDFKIDLEKELSLIIGKNNTGKTSILSTLDKFLNEKNKFLFDDFNIGFKKELKSLIENCDNTEIPYVPVGIKLKIFIEYTDKDNLSNVSKVMMDLDPENNIIVLGFEYTLGYSDYFRIVDDFKIFTTSEALKKQVKNNYVEKGLYDFLKYNQANYFKVGKKSFEYNLTTQSVNEENYIDLVKENISIKDIISFKHIGARRDVTNREVDKTLSRQTSSIYRTTGESEDKNEATEKFKDQLSETDQSLSNIYEDLFKDVIDKVKLFGGIKINESEIKIISTLHHKELLDGNTTVVYKHDPEHDLPEHYNGLGYMNLISMIFEIEIILHEFKRDKDKKPADINLLFIEEPEAHTHPQMQYVFIKNIKKLLKGGIIREDGIKRELQYIISTHSSCIVSDSDFDDIKYLKRDKLNFVISKNLKDLEKDYIDDGQEKYFRFLKQYLTLNRAELFFADKAIFIEGDTERILLPAMMKKIDQEFPDNPLLSQNISIIEVGAHSHIFEKFIDFIGIRKSIVITDIDSYYLSPEFESDGITQKKYKTTNNPVFNSIKCSANDTKAQYTSNNSLIFFHKKNKDIAYFKKLGLDWKILRKNKNKKWVSNKKGALLVMFQIEENNYHARSFEDSFFHLNKNFITDVNNFFPSLTSKHLDEFRNNTIEVFSFSEKAVGSKPSLAIEILINSKKDNLDNEFSNWQIPAYIKEGLLWLKKD